MDPQNTPPGTGTTLEACEDTVVARMQAAEAVLRRFEARAREKRLQARIARAKADIDAAAMALKTSLDAFGRRYSALSNE